VKVAIFGILLVWMGQDDNVTQRHAGITGSWVVAAVPISDQNINIVDENTAKKHVSGLRMFQILPD
jgi:hypothetical protein